MMNNFVRFVKFDIIWMFHNIKYEMSYYDI